MAYNETPTKGKTMSIPQTILEANSVLFIPVILMDPEQLAIMNVFIETLIMTMKEGTATSFEELNEMVVDKLLDSDDPFLD